MEVSSRCCEKVCGLQLTSRGQGGRFFRFPLTVFLRPKLEVRLSFLDPGLESCHFTVFSWFCNLCRATVLDGVDGHVWMAFPQSIAAKFFNRDSIQNAGGEIVGRQNRVRPAAESPVIFAL